MPRFFVEPGCLSDGRVTITGPDAHHMGRVLRLGVGADVSLLDGSGWLYPGTIEAVGPEGVTVGLHERQRVSEPPLPITLVQALPKADKLEFVIQKATELGAWRIVAVPSARSVVQLKGDRTEGKLGRWQKIAKEAAEQSERGTIPEVQVVPSLNKLTWAAGTLALVLSERSAGLTLPCALPAEPPAGVALFVGPEGGWTREELDALVARGALEVGLGPRILRTETAGLAALAIVMATYELR